MINTNNHGKETDENLKPYYLEQKNLNLVIKPSVGEVSDNLSVETGKGKGGIVTCWVFNSQHVLFLNSPFKIKMRKMMNNRIFFFKFENLILKIFTRTRILSCMIMAVIMRK